MDVQSPIGRVVQKMAGSGWFAKVAPTFIPRLDRFLHRVSGGRIIISGGLLPSMMLTTTGRKSGQQRSVPLATLPVDGGWIVVGSNFGREHHPAWSSNLLAEPKATVSFKGTTYDVVAHPLDDDEKQALWPQLTTFWPVYDKYVERSGRDLRVFRLEKTV